LETDNVRTHSVLYMSCFQVHGLERNGITLVICSDSEARVLVIELWTETESPLVAGCLVTRCQSTILGSGLITRQTFDWNQTKDFSLLVVNWENRPTIPGKPLVMLREHMVKLETDIEVDWTSPCLIVATVMIKRI